MKINHESCKRCKLCIEVCPCKILNIGTDNKIFFKPERKHICLECGHCMAICSTESITIKELNYSDNIFLAEKTSFNYEDFMSFLQTRRSIRQYKDKTVEKELINKIIEAVSFAPYGALHDNVSINIVEKDTIKKALPLMSEFYDNVVSWFKSPIKKFFIKRRVNSETYNTLTNHLLPIAKTGHYKITNDYNSITRNAPSLLIFHAPISAEEHTEDIHIYVTYAMLAAHSLGLGASVIGLVGPPTNKNPELKKIFKIPDSNEVISSLIIGYPKYKYKKFIKRKKLKIISV